MDRYALLLTARHLDRTAKRIRAQAATADDANAAQRLRTVAKRIESEAFQLDRITRAITRPNPHRQMMRLANDRQKVIP